MESTIERKKTSDTKNQEKSGRNLLCRASFFSSCNHYSQRAYCTKESACYQKLSRLHLPVQACFLVPPGKSQKRRNGRNRKCFITAEGKSLEYREYRLDVSPEYQHSYRTLIIFQEESLQYLAHDRQIAQDLDDRTLVAVSEKLLTPGDDKVKFHWCTAHHYLFPTNLIICSSRPSSCAKCKEKRLQKHTESGSSRKRKLSPFHEHDQVSLETLPSLASNKRANFIQDLASSLLLPSFTRSSYPSRSDTSGLRASMYGLSPPPSPPVSSLSDQLSWLLSAHTTQGKSIQESSLYANITAAQLLNSINRVCTSSGLFEDQNWLGDFNTGSSPSSAELVSMISQSCQIRIPTPRYPVGTSLSSLRACI